jgi:putative flippase GtrA
MTFVLAIGRPNVFTDTRDYMINGARFYQALHRTFLGEKPPAPKTPEEQQAWQKLKWQMHFDHSNAGARSPYYGILLYTLAHRGTLWLLSAVQALCCAWLVFLLWRQVAAEAPGWTYYALMAALALTTSLPWVASFAMPDIFAAVLIMAATLLLFYRKELSRWEQVGVVALLGASTAFHGSHVLLTMALAAVAVAIGRVMKADKRTVQTFVRISAAAVVTAVVAQAVYAEAIKLHTGDEFRRPPFLMARVIADGPGRAYLRHSCAEGAAWAICPFRNEALDDSDHILWSALPGVGVFNRSDYETRVAMEKQETDFVIGTLVYDPIGQFAAAMKNWGLQLVSFYVDDPLRRPWAFITHNYWGHTNLVDLLRGVGECGKTGELCQPKVEIGDLELADNTFAALALIGLILALVHPRGLRGVLLQRRFRWSDPMARASAACLFITAAIIANAGVCGMIAGVFARYQSRVVWLLPAEALLLGMALVPAASWRSVRLAGADNLDLVWGRLQPAFARLALATARLRRRALGAATAQLGQLDASLIRFGVVGCIGFVVDFTVLRLLVSAAAVNPILAQVPAFGVAVIVTWMLNRVWTFDAVGRDSRLRQAALYLGVQCVGAATNFVVYTALLLIEPVLKNWLVIPLGIGAVVAMGLTFLGSKYLAFRDRRPLTAEAVTDAAVADTPTA